MRAKADYCSSEQKEDVWGRARGGGRKELLCMRRAPGYLCFAHLYCLRQCGQISHDVRGTKGRLRHTELRKVLCTPNRKASLGRQDHDGESGAQRLERETEKQEFLSHTPQSVVILYSSPPTASQTRLPGATKQLPVVVLFKDNFSRSLESH